MDGAALRAAAYARHPQVIRTLLSDVRLVQFFGVDTGGDVFIGAGL